MTDREARLEKALVAVVKRWRQEAGEMRFSAQDPALKDRSRSLIEQAAHSLDVCASELEKLLASTQPEAPPEPPTPEPDPMECPGCGCSLSACDAFRTSGQVCCPDCRHRPTPTPEPRKVNLGVIEFHSPRLNPGLIERFYAVVEDLRASGSIVDIWLMDIATVLREFGYEMTIVSTTKPAPSTVQSALTPEPERPMCGAVREIVAGMRAICELPQGHSENHRGPMVHGAIAQWPEPERPAARCVWRKDTHGRSVVTNWFRTDCGLQIGVPKSWHLTTRCICGQPLVVEAPHA